MSKKTIEDALLPIGFLVFATFLYLLGFLKVGWFIVYIEIANIFGVSNLPYLSTVWSSTLLIPALVLSCLSIALIQIVARKNLAMRHSPFIILIVIAIFFIFSISSVFLVYPAKNSINNFETNYSSNPLPQYLDNISTFISKNIAYNELEALKIDDLFLRINPSGADYPFLNWLGIDRASVIVFQKYGSCGEDSMLIQELLSPTGYETRLAKYVNQDHEWCEIFYHNQWEMIVVENGSSQMLPLMDAKALSQTATGVQISLPNGTWIDDGYEHGFTGN